MDIRIVQRGGEFEAVTLDWLLLPTGALDTSEELATAVRVALLTHRRADDADELPDDRSTDRRGWWGDMDAEVVRNGWPIGSRLWLLARAKITGAAAAAGATAARIEQYLAEALEPFVEQRIATSYSVSVRRTDTNRIDADIVLYRGDQPEVRLRYPDLWAMVRA